MSHSTSIKTPTGSGAPVHSVDLPTLWEVVLEGFNVFPSQSELDGVPLGDVGICESLKKSDGLGLVPFHKLSQCDIYPQSLPSGLFS
jgi:hypothetical protein